MSRSAYRITIEGELDDVTAAAFPDLVVTRSSGCTELRTAVLDQAALNGVLDRLRVVGAALVSLDRSAPADACVDTGER